MPYQSRPRQSIVELVEKKGGAIWTTTTHAAATVMTVSDIGLNRITIEQYHVPNCARTLLGWRPVGYPCDQAASESLVWVADIRGVDYNFQPQEVICGNVGPSIMTTSGGILHAASEYYDVFAPVQGDERSEVWDVGCEAIDAIAGTIKVGAEFTWTNIRVPELPVIRSKCSREDAIQAAGATAGTVLQPEFCHNLIEIGAYAAPAAPTVEEELNVTLRAICTSLQPVQEVKIMLEPSGALANLANDEGVPRGYVARRAQRLMFNQEKVNIETNWDVDVANTNAGQAVSMFRYT